MYISSHFDCIALVNHSWSTISDNDGLIECICDSEAVSWITLTFSTDEWTPKVKQLPPCLFERIISKSKELQWFIHVARLKDFLPFRNILRWKNVDLRLLPRYSTDVFLRDDALEKLNKVSYPIKNLSIFLVELTDKVLVNLRALGSTIESLDIMYYMRSILF